jgi:hypothetical protein
MVLPFLQMKERHPHFRWHARNWVLVHITVMHLRAMRHSLKDPDPDLKALEVYNQLMAKGTIKKRKIRPEPESSSKSSSEVSLNLQLTLHILIDPSPIAQCLKKSTWFTQSTRLASTCRQMQVPVSTQALIANPTNVALSIG